MDPLEKIIRDYITSWVGDDKTGVPIGEAALNHFFTCAANLEAQFCCLDKDHERFDEFVVGLAKSLETANGPG